MPIRCVPGILAIPRYIVLAFLYLGAILTVVIAWFVILITGRYSKPLFDYVVGVSRWSLRVSPYVPARHRPATPLSA